MIFFILLSGVIGLFFGSFATVLIRRWHDNTPGILFGRSECPKCHHELKWYELFPVFSYIFLLGRCRGCHTKISTFYILTECSMGVAFALMVYAVMNITGDILPIHLLFGCVLAFVTVVYMIYDIRYMEIPDQILVPAIFGYIGLLILGFIFPDIQSLFFDQITYDGGYSDYVIDHVTAGIVLYSFFFLQILIPGLYQLIGKKAWKDALMLTLSYFTFPIELLLNFRGSTPPSEERDETELKTWVGGGDLRVALFIGLTLGLIHSMAALFASYIIGSIVAIILIAKGRKNHMIPFGPFLGIGWFLSMVFYTDILNYIFQYTNI